MAMATAEKEGQIAQAPSLEPISLDLEEKNNAEKDEDEEKEEEFAFAIPSADPEGGFQFSSAEEIFFNGQIRSAYSLPELGFRMEANELPNKANLNEERKIASVSCSTATSDAEILEGISAESYCLWTPTSAPDIGQRSNSAGESKRWRLRDLVIGRSHSDGKKKFIFLEPNRTVVEKKEKKKTEEMDMARAHRLFYSKGGAPPSGDRRKSYLPYRSNVVGFFNGSQPF